jgi:hypothetical protein
MDNDEGEYLAWKDATMEAWDNADDKHPNQFMDRASNARSILAERLKNVYDDQSEHPVFKAADGTMYGDLLNAALGSVDWYEIADSLLSELAEDDEEVEYQAVK